MREIRCHAVLRYVCEQYGFILLKIKPNKNLHSLKYRDKGFCKTLKRSLNAQMEASNLTNTTIAQVAEVISVLDVGTSTDLYSSVNVRNLGNRNSDI